MSPQLASPLARALAALLALALATLLAGSVATSEAQARGCGWTGVASKATKRIDRNDARKAVRCLINKARSGSNLKLRRKLSKAAQRHSRHMARKRCFSHQCRGEPSLSERIRQSGYLNGASSYRFGEVIALNRARATPRQIVRQWKRSSGHRAQIMSSGYRHMGVGIKTRGGKSYYTVTLGWKSG